MRLTKLDNIKIAKFNIEYAVKVCIPLFRISEMFFLRKVYTILHLVVVSTSFLKLPF